MATLLPWLWALGACFRRRSRRNPAGRVRAAWLTVAGLVFAAELGLTYALARTYSRGALVGAALGAAAWGVAAWRGSRRPNMPQELAAMTTPPGASPDASSPGAHGRWRREWATLAPWCGRGLLFALALAVTGFHARLAPEHLAGDKSSLNRLVLWRGGAELVAASPLHGWGWGRSGASFMHWTQPLGRDEGYLSMVNSYLTVAVEAGLPLFTLLLALLLLPLSSVWFAPGRPAPNPPPTSAAVADAGESTPGGGALLRQVPASSPALSAFYLAAVASWSAWLGCLIFSNLWIIPGLWIVPGLAALGLLPTQAHTRTSGRASVFVTGGAAILVSLGLWVAGAILAARQPLQLTRAAEGKISLIARATPGTPAAGSRTKRVLVVPDAEVLGENYGQELRRWLLADSRISELRVFSQEDSIGTSELSSASAILLCGAAAGEATDPRLAKIAGPVWLLHPTPAAPETPPSWAAGSRVLLPGIDVNGQAATWWPWAARAEPPIRVILSSGLALDVRPRWPRMAQESFSFR